MNGRRKVRVQVDDGRSWVSQRVGVNKMAMGRWTSWALVLATALAVSMVGTPTAHAGGVEFPAPGTRALGRGGAAAARPDDPMALYYNPAALASVSGIQLSLQTHVALFSACMLREGNHAGKQPIFGAPNGLGVTEANLTDDFAEVCNSGAPGIIPELILTWRVNERLGLSLGLVAPSAVGVQRWGSSGQIGDRRVIGLQDGLPAATRYSLVEQNLLIAFPTIGAGFAVHPRLHIGLAFGSGFGILNFKTMTRATAGEDFGADILSELSATDPFIPRITASVHAIPIDALDIALTFNWTDSVRAEGDLDLTTGYYQENPVDFQRISGTQITAPMPWQLGLSIRYADRIAPRSRADLSRLSGQVEDEMSNERWDIELDIMYERNSNVDRFFTDIPVCDPALGSCAGDSWTVAVDQGAPPTPIPTTIPLAHQYRDQLSIRLGGDYNIMPGFFTMRAGVSYETRGVTEGYEQIDFMPFQRVGAHLGATFRFGNFDLSLAYAHLFQQTVTVSQDNAQLRQTNALYRLNEILCENGDSGCDTALLNNQDELRRGTIVNAGRFKSSFNIFSLGLTYHFR